MLSAIVVAGVYTIQAAPAKVSNEEFWRSLMQELEANSDKLADLSPECLTAGQSPAQTAPGNQRILCSSCMEAPCICRQKQECAESLVAFMQERLKEYGSIGLVFYGYENGLYGRYYVWNDQEAQQIFQRCSNRGLSPALVVKYAQQEVRRRLIASRNTSEDRKNYDLIACQLEEIHPSDIVVKKLAPHEVVAEPAPEPSIQDLSIQLAKKILEKIGIVSTPPKK